MENKKLNLKKLKWYSTQSVDYLMHKQVEFAKEVCNAIDRYCNHDWGNLTDADKKLNNIDFNKREGHVLGKYNTSRGDIYINTDDYETVMIMFVKEY